MIGECVGYTAPLIGNTCNVQFVDKYVMIFREYFTAVQKVVPVLTNDEDLTYVVEELGITLAYPIDIDRPIEFNYIKKCSIITHM